MKRVAGHDFPAIQVGVTADGLRLGLAPTDETGRQLFAHLTADMNRYGTWHSGGKVMDRPLVGTRLVGVYVWAGGQPQDYTEGNSTRTIYPGAATFYLDTSGVTDAEALDLLSTLAWYGMRLHEDSTPETLLLVPSSPCELCSGPLTQYRELEFRVCDECATNRCPHDYEEGIGVSGGMPVVMTFCGTCGRPHPDWRPPQDPAAAMVDTVASGHLNALVVTDPDGGATTITRRKG